MLVIDRYVSRRFAPTSLMLGNVATGMSVLAPAGMLLELSSDLGVTVRDAGLLVTVGAIVLCIGSPLTAWLTSRFDRRALLGFALAVLAIANIASAFAPNYTALLVIRVVMLAIGALYTPQAAGTVGMIVPVEKRGSGISYVFLGWSLAAAVGLPLITLLASRYGWRAAYGGIGAISCISFVLLVLRLPSGLFGAPVDLKTWVAIGRNPLILLLLLVTVLQMSGQFVVFTFIGPLLAKLTRAGPDAIGFAFLLYGALGFVGNMIAARVVDSWGSYRTSFVFTTMLFIGMAIWAFGAGSFTAMTIGVAIWGLGFASTNSMQQVRLIGAAPVLANASVSLNTSALYVGQAVGSAIGGALFASELYLDAGYVALGFIALAIGVLLTTRRR